MKKLWAPLELTFEMNSVSCDFLDLTIYRKPQDWLTPNRGTFKLCFYTKLYQKPKNLYQYLHWNSNHDTTVFKAIIKGEVIRYLRICSERKWFRMAKTNLKNRLLQRKYPPKIIHECFKKTPVFDDRSRYLFKTKNNEEKLQNPNFYKTFERNYPFDLEIEEILERNWDKLPGDLKYLPPPKIVNKYKANLQRRYFN